MHFSHCRAIHIINLLINVYLLVWTAFYFDGTVYFSQPRSRSWNSTDASYRRFSANVSGLVKLFFPTNMTYFYLYLSLSIQENVIFYRRIRHKTNHIKWDKLSVLRIIHNNRYSIPLKRQNLEVLQVCFVCLAGRNLHNVRNLI